MAEEGFDCFLDLVYGVEESLDVDLAVFSSGVRIYLDETSRKLLGVKGVRIQSGAVVEEEFAADLVDGGVQQGILTVENDDRVNDVLEVPDLMG